MIHGNHIVLSERVKYYIHVKCYASLMIQERVPFHMYSSKLIFGSGKSPFPNVYQQADFFSFFKKFIEKNPSPGEQIYCCPPCSAPVQAATLLRLLGVALITGN